MRSIRVSVLAAGLMVMVAPICVRADLGVDLTSPTTNVTNGSWSLGWAFTVTQPFIVQAMEFYDDQKNGLTQSHNVGVFNTDDELIVSGQVTGDDPLDSWWRWTDAAPTVIEPDLEHRIAAITSSENCAWNPEGFSAASGVNFLSSVYEVASSTDLVSPKRSDARTKGYFGPNFSAGNVLVPLPGLVLLLVLGFLTIGAKRKSSQ